MIALLAGKVSGIVIFLLACLSVPLGLGLAVESVRLNGLSVVGWTIADGYKPLYLKDERDMVTLRGDQQVLAHGLDTCNTSVLQIAKTGKDLEAAAALLIAEREHDAAQLMASIAGIKAIKSTDEKCPVADSILQAGFGK